MNRALAIDHATDEWTAVEYIGNPEDINSSYGLMDGSGARLAECLRAQGAPAFVGWPSWADTFHLAEQMPLLIGGATWYHWVGVRGVQPYGLLLANSARGWQAIYDVLLEDDFDRLGPFAVVAVPLLRNFPPPASA
jgi:hypothetical protein